MTSRNLLLVSRVLERGGIQNIFLNLAKYRYNNGLPTVLFILSQSPKNDLALENEFKKYCRVVSYEQVFGTMVFPLLSCGVKNNFLNFKDTVVHCTDGYSYFVINYLLFKSGIATVNITLGFYHPLQFKSRLTRYFPHLSKDLSQLNKIPVQNLFFFTKSLKKKYEIVTGLNFHNAPIFPLGVVSGDTVNKSATGETRSGTAAQIVIVGRQSISKKYLEKIPLVVNELAALCPVNIKFIGDGPLNAFLRGGMSRSKAQSVTFLGSMPLDELIEEIKTADICLASGTTCVHAAKLGIPTITCIDNLSEPSSKGWFCDVYNDDYSTMYEKDSCQKVYDLLLDYFDRIVECPQELSDLKSRHAEMAKYFSIEKMNENFVSNKIKATVVTPPRNRFVYECSRLALALFKRIVSKRAFDIYR